MHWEFCPHCETQLDDATGICPACRWDPREVAPRAQPAATRSITERYRGTAFEGREASAALAVAPGGRVSRARLFLLIGMILVMALYGTLIVYADHRAHHGQPAVVLRDVSR
jgi:hypothetical protein